MFTHSLSTTLCLSLLSLVLISSLTSASSDAAAPSRGISSLKLMAGVVAAAHTLKLGWNHFVRAPRRAPAYEVLARYTKSLSTITETAETKFDTFQKDVDDHISFKLPDDDKLKTIHAKDFFNLLKNVIGSKQANWDARSNIGKQENEELTALLQQVKQDAQKVHEEFKEKPTILEALKYKRESRCSFFSVKGFIGFWRP